MGVILLPLGALVLMAPFLALFKGFRKVFNFFSDLFGGSNSEENENSTEIQ